MPYTRTTEQLVILCSEGRELIRFLFESNSTIKKEKGKKGEIEKEVEEKVLDWRNRCLETLGENGLFIEHERFCNYTGSALMREDLNLFFNGKLNYVKDRQNLLLSFAQNIESRKSNKEIISIKVEDIQNFAGVETVKFEDVEGFCESAFLEDDIESVFLKAFGEPYKELDSGAETRDLFTDRLIVEGRRLDTAIMFKGRGVRTPLRIRDCGKNGDQLLKLAKNKAAQCFIVQHVHKIEPAVKEALNDHVLSNSIYSKVYVCFIDGVDTARVLKSRGLNLEELKQRRGRE